MRNIAKLARDTRGVTALEYSVIAGVLGFLLIVGYGHIGAKLKTAFVTIEKHI